MICLGKSYDIIANDTPYSGMNQLSAKWCKQWSHHSFLLSCRKLCAWLCACLCPTCIVFYKKILLGQKEVALWREMFSARLLSMPYREYFKNEDFDKTGQTVKVRYRAIPSLCSQFPSSPPKAMYITIGCKINQCHMNFSFLFLSFLFFSECVFCNTWT